MSSIPMYSSIWPFQIIYLISLSFQAIVLFQTSFHTIQTLNCVPIKVFCYQNNVVMSPNSTLGFLPKRRRLVTKKPSRDIEKSMMAWNSRMDKKKFDGVEGTNQKVHMSSRQYTQGIITKLVQLS